MFADDAANLNVQSMIGKDITVTIQLDGMGVSSTGKGIREISGIVTEAGFISQDDRRSRYRLIMEPNLCLAKKHSDFRIFQNESIIDIINEVLRPCWIVKDWRISHPEQYQRLDYQVQYGETDFDFVQRLLEENGIYWFFEHSGTFHRMILVNQMGAHKPVESDAYHTLHYYPPGHKIDMEYVDHFQTQASIQSGIWTTNDFDFKKPGAHLVAQKGHPLDTAHNLLERYEWPGDYTNPQEGERLAQIRMQEISTQGERAKGSGNLRDVACGTTFHLAGYPHKEANREYLVISATLEATETGDTSGSGEYHFHTAFEVQPATVVFRPPRTITKPRTSGPQTAIVTGQEGSEIWTDKYGRVKVKFHRDHSQKRITTKGTTTPHAGSACHIRGQAAVLAPSAYRA